MPQIQVEIGPATKEQKDKLISELTKTASSILDVREESFYVLIKENSLDNWGVGGRTLRDILSEDNN